MLSDLQDSSTGKCRKGCTTSSTCRPAYSIGCQTLAVPDATQSIRSIRCAKQTGAGWRGGMIIFGRGEGACGFPFPVGTWGLKGQFIFKCTKSTGQVDLCSTPFRAEATTQAPSRASSYPLVSQPAGVWRAELAKQGRSPGNTAGRSTQTVTRSSRSRRFSCNSVQLLHNQKQLHAVAEAINRPL